MALAMNADLNSLNDWGRTPLEDFAELYVNGGPDASMRKQMCDLLISANATITARARILLDLPTTQEEKSHIIENSDQTILFESVCRSGRLKWLELLVQTSADANHEDSCGIPILCATAKFPSLVEYLVAQGATVNKRVKYRCPFVGAGLMDDATALHFAAEVGSVRSIEILCAHGADPNIQENTGQSPLHIAAFFGHGEVVKALLACGARTDLRDSLQNTPAEVVLKQFARHSLVTLDDDALLAISLLNPDRPGVDSKE